MRRKIIFYRKEDSTAPVEVFLDSLKEKVVQKILAVLKLIEELDVIPDKFFKKLKDTNIWECRIKWESNIYRIFSFYQKKNKVVLTHGIIKKSQKTPKKEIERAEKYRLDYIEREMK